MLSFKATVSTVISSILHEPLSLTKSGEVQHVRVEGFVLRQISNMPDYTRLAIFVLTLMLDFLGLFIALRPFHSLPHPKRMECIAALQKIPVGLFRDLVRFYETLAAFGYCASEEPADLLIADPMQNRPLSLTH